MTDKNGKPLNVGDKVTHPAYPGDGIVVHTGADIAVVKFDGVVGVAILSGKYLTLVEPEPPIDKPIEAPIDLGGDDSIKAMKEARPPRKHGPSVFMADLLASEEGKHLLDALTKPAPVVTALMGGKVESQESTFPLPEPDYKGLLDEEREKVRKLTRAAVAVLTSPSGIEQASAYARLRDAVKEAL